MEPIQIEIGAGYHIDKACEEAVEQADKIGLPISFDFNGIQVIVQPGEKPETAAARWNTDFTAKQTTYLASDEYKEAQRKREEEQERKLSAVLKESAQTEPEMRDAKDPWPYTPKQLMDYIDSLTERGHDYGTCVYAMSLAAIATFNYVAHKLGTTGFQSDCADFDFLRRRRHINGPFILLKGEDILYPQYNLPVELAEAMREWKPWLKEQAQKKIDANSSGYTHPDVLAHWEKLAH